MKSQWTSQPFWWKLSQVVNTTGSACGLEVRGRGGAWRDGRTDGYTVNAAVCVSRDDCGDGGGGGRDGGGCGGCGGGGGGGGGDDGAG